jgi:hypothetical protein
MQMSNEVFCFLHKGLLRTTLFKFIVKRQFLDTVPVGSGQGMVI